MEEANLALSNNLAAVVAVLGLIIITLVILLINLKSKLNALQEKYVFLRKEKKPILIQC